MMSSSPVRVAYLEGMGVSGNRGQRTNCLQEAIGGKVGRRLIGEAWG
jgi:hypothetical protein